MDKKEFTAIMKTLAVNSSVELDTGTLTLYYEIFKNIATIDEFREAAKKVLTTWKFSRMPPIGEILEHIGDRPKQIENIATVEANRILAHLQAWGGLKWPVLDDPITQYLMTRRWKYDTWASNVLESELKWWVKEFVQAYQAHVEADDLLQINSNAPENIKKLIKDIGGKDAATREGSSTDS